MNAIEIRGLTKHFGKKQALRGLDMTVPAGAIYGLIGENGAGKSTAEKLICGLMPKDGGSIQLYGKPHTDPEVRVRIGVLIEAPGCFPNISVWGNMMLQASNLGLRHAEEEVGRVLKLVRMEGAASNKFRNCSLGMKQRIGIAMALLGDPELLILDEPINGLDADGMRIMRDVLTDITRDKGRTVLISSHILSELEKIATHYGILRGGRKLCEMTAAQLDANCRTYISLETSQNGRAKQLLQQGPFARVEEDERGRIRIYDAAAPEEVSAYLYRNGIPVRELGTEKIGLQEYYMDLMQERRAQP